MSRSTLGPLNQRLARKFANAVQSRRGSVVYLDLECGCSHSWDEQRVSPHATPSRTHQGTWECDVCAPTLED